MDRPVDYTIQKYLNEMIKMSRNGSINYEKILNKAVDSQNTAQHNEGLPTEINNNQAETIEEELKQPIKQQEDSFFQAQVYSGNEAIPIYNAKIIVRKKDSIIAFLVSDENGETPVIKVLAPLGENTLEPYNPDKVADYSVDVEAKGFSSIRDIFVGQVGGTGSLVRINLVPVPEGGAKI